MLRQNLSRSRKHLSPTPSATAKKPGSLPVAKNPAYRLEEAQNAKNTRPPLPQPSLASRRPRRPKFDPGMWLGTKLKFELRLMSVNLKPVSTLFKGLNHGNANGKAQAYTNSRFIFYMSLHPCLSLHPDCHPSGYIFHARILIWSRVLAVFILCCKCCAETSDLERGVARLRF